MQIGYAIAMRLSPQRHTLAVLRILIGLTQKEMAELAGPVDAPAIPADQSSDAANHPVISFTTPLISSNAELDGRSISELIAGSPKFAPIEGMPNEIWQNKTCSTCHQWTKEALCTQAGTYAAKPESIARISHPYGRPFKQSLSQWSTQGCL